MIFVTIVRILILTQGISLCRAHFLLIEEDPDVEIISQALHNIVDKFLIEQNIKFNILVFKPTTLTLSLLDKFLKTSKNIFSCSILIYENYRTKGSLWTLSYSYIIFLSSIFDFNELELIYKSLRYDDDHIKYFVFIPYIVSNDIRMHKIFTAFKRMIFYSNYLLHHTFFITNDLEYIILASIEYYMPGFCGQSVLIRLNSFQKKSRKWTWKLKNYDKFMQYRGCELVFMVPVLERYVGPFIEADAATHFSGFCYFKDNQTNFQAYGISPKIFEIGAKIFNYTVDYQPVLMEEGWILEQSPYKIHGVQINRSLKVPVVYFELSALHNYQWNLLASTTIVDLTINMVVTPGEKYTPYEKFFLPFDLETWVLLATTFLLTIFCILIINHTSKFTQNLVYGHQVETPFWNVVSIFFGISQTKLPEKNFARFILILFVYFCLIFRTCFQSKFFEFMTSEPRRPAPKSIEEVISMNYNVYSQWGLRYFTNKKTRSEQWPDIKFLSDIEFSEALKTKSQNSSSKIALCVDDLLRKHYENFDHKNYKWNELEDPVLVKYPEVFMFMKNAFYTPMYKKLIENLIPPGIMQYLIEIHYYKKSVYPENEVDEPKVLNLYDLMSGFNIWLIFCFLSTLAFVSEHLINCLMRPKKLKIRKIKFAKLHPEYEAAIVCKCKLSKELIEVFRIKSSNENKTQNNFNFDLYFGGIVSIEIDEIEEQ